MHPFALNYERKTPSNHDKKIPRDSNASSSSTTLNHPSSSCPLDDIVDENNEESFHSNSSSPSQNISSSSNVVSRVRQNPPHESPHLNTYLSETINIQAQQRDAHQEGLRSIGKALKDMMSEKWKSIPPKTAEQKLARKNEWKAKITLLLAIPDEQLFKFHGIKDAKTLWEAIKARFRGNKESNKMQKIILKQQYENFTTSRSERLDKTYDRFQKLISQLEIHGEVISQEDANLKLLRSLPSAWNNIDLIMRNKSNLDTLSMDDLYNNLKVYESEIKGQSSSSSNSQNVAFVSLENTSSTNEAVNTAHEVSTASSQGQASSSTYADDVMFSFFANQFNSPQLDNEDLKQIDTDDLEEMDLKWRGHFARECMAPRNQVNKNRDAPRRVVPVETHAKDLVVQDGIEIIGYQMGLESLEARIVVHEKNEVVYEEDIAFLNQINAKDKASLGYDSQMNKSEVVHSVFRPKSDQTKPKFTKINFVKSDENVKSVNKENIHKQVEYPRKSQSPRGNRRNWNGLMTQKLGNGFESIKKACFVCGSFNHLIKDCDFHDKKMVENHSLKAATSISTARPVNTAASKSKVNDALPITYSYFKAHSPVKRAFNQKSAAKTNNFNEKVNAVRVNNVTTTGAKAVVSAAVGNGENAGNPQYTLQDQGIFDSGCSRHMTGNKSFLTDYQEIDGGFVSFGGSPKGGKITGKVLSPDFKLLDESQVLLKVPRQNNMYSFDLKNVVPSGGLTCLFAKATIDESNLWHRRLGHLDCKTMNKLVRGNLVRGLPTKLFENYHTFVACQKGKQHKASCKTKLVSSISQRLQMLHIDLFGPTSVRSINHKTYFLVVTDDYSRCDNGTEFKNNDMNSFYGMKGIKREFSVARTP
ncbi:putative ribonuclease H-like domain-containing protein [Tanacetum coccineum]